MKINRFPLGSVAFVCMLAFSVSLGHSTPNRIEWYSYEKGLSLAKQEAKKVYLLFESGRCPACKKMRAETFQNPAVIRYLNDHFIAVSVNIVRQSDIANRYYVIGVPTSRFISDDGYSIQIPPGFYAADEFLQWLKYIQTDSYKSMSFANFMKKTK